MEPIKRALDRLEKEAFKIIRTGDFVKVYADEGMVTVVRQKSRGNNE